MTQIKDNTTHDDQKGISIRHNENEHDVRGSNSLIITYIIFQEGPRSIHSVGGLQGRPIIYSKNHRGGHIRHGSGLLPTCRGNIVRYRARGMSGGRDRGLRDDWILRVDDDCGPVSSIGTIIVG